MTVIVNGAQVAKDSLGITDGSSEGKQIIRKKNVKTIIIIFFRMQS